MKLFNRTTANEEKLEKEESKPSFEEINETISATQYFQTDSIANMLVKYRALCNLQEKCDDKQQKKAIHNAQWVFINSIQIPNDKQELRELIVGSLPFAKSYSKGSDMLKAVTSIGLKTLKGVSTVGKVATLGLASKAIDTIADATQTALVSCDEELMLLWRNKLSFMFEKAKALSGSSLSKDKEFVSQLKELKRQFDEMCGN